MSDKKAKWTRPESVPIPTVWYRFEGRKPFSNGKIPKFRIQDVPDDLREEAVDLMCRVYARDEARCQALNIQSDPVTMRTYRDRWSKCVDHRLSLLVILENKDELEDDSLPVVAGCNMLAVVYPDSPKVKAENKMSRDLFGIVNQTYALVDVFKVYNISEYMCGYGFAVETIYRGQGIGDAMMQARSNIGKAVGIKMQITCYSSTSAQKVAQKFGFEKIAELKYADYRDENGEAVFKDSHTETLQLMIYKFY